MFVFSILSFPKMANLNASINVVQDETVPRITRIKRGTKGGTQVFWLCEGIEWKGFVRKRNRSSNSLTVYCHRYGRQASVCVTCFLCILKSIWSSIRITNKLCNYTFKCAVEFTEKDQEYYDPNYWTVLPRKPRKNCIIRHGFVSMDHDLMKECLNYIISQTLWGYLCLLIIKQNQAQY